MLKFIGSGSAFNVELGNTSAYIKDGDKLDLFDCGSSVFERIIKLDILKDVKYVNIFITHTHSDHIGSLGTLIHYLHFVKNIKPVVVYPFMESLQHILEGLGVDKDLYYLLQKPTDDCNKCAVDILDIIPIGHDINFNMVRSYAYTFKYNNKVIYYSGDSNEISPTTLDMFNNGKIDYLYQDTCSIDYENNVHLFIDKLCGLIPPELRHRVYCIHLDSNVEGDIFHPYEELGFNVVSNEKYNNVKED